MTAEKHVGRTKPKGYTMSERFIEYFKFQRLIWPITVSLMIFTLLASENVADCRKSKAEIQYELEVEYINNRKDLDWSEKVKARLETYERIFEPEKREKRLLEEAEEERRKLFSKKKLKRSEKAEPANEEKETKTAILVVVYVYAIIALALIFLGYKVYLKHTQRKLTIDGYKLKKFPVLMLILKLSTLSLLIFCFGLGLIEQIQNYIRYQDHPNSQPLKKAEKPENEVPLSIAANVIRPNTIVLKIRTNISDKVEGLVFLSQKNESNSDAEIKYEEKIQITDGLKVVIIEGQKSGLNKGHYLAGIRIKGDDALKSEMQKIPLSEQIFEKTIPVYLPDVLQAKQASYPTLSNDKTGKLDNCYELGYRFGMCSTKAMNGMVCDPANDIVLPKKCRNKAETKRGLEAGVSVAKALIVGKKNDISKPFSGLPELRNKLVGKAENEVIAVLGRPSRTEMFAGKKCWIYGKTFTSKDIGVVFDGGKVLTITYY